MPRLTELSGLWGIKQETHLSGTVLLSGPLSTTNKIADKRNVLVGSLIFLSLVITIMHFICHFVQ